MGVITESKSKTKSEEVRCSLRSLLTLSQQYSTTYYFSMNRRVKKDQDVPWSQGNYQQTLQAASTTVNMCERALDRSDILVLSMTCQATLSSSFWSEVLGPSPVPNCVVPVTSTLFCLWHSAFPWAAFMLTHSDLQCWLNPGDDLHYTSETMDWTSSQASMSD